MPKMSKCKISRMKNFKRAKIHVEDDPPGTDDVMLDHSSTPSPSKDRTDAMESIEIKVEHIQLETIWRLFWEFENLEFSQNIMPFTQFIVDWNQRLQRVVDVGICYPDIVLAFKLLKQTNLPAERRSLIIAALQSYLEEDRSRNLLQEAIGLLDKIYENKESIKNEAVLEKEENFASKLLEKTEVDFEPMDEPVEAFYDDENGISEQNLFHHSFENNHLKEATEIKVESQDVTNIHFTDTDQKREFPSEDEHYNLGRCPNCDKVLSTPSSLHRHIQSCRKCYECKKCGLILKNKKEYILHRKQHRDELVRLRRRTKDFHVAFTPEEREVLGKCPNCSKLLCSPTLLKKHLVVCKLNLNCEECKTLFSSKWELNEHMKTHTAKCKSCEAEFETQKSLKSHFFFVHKEKIYECDECKKSFPTENMLRAHMTVHKPKLSKTSVFQCDQCGLEFVGKIKLRIHKRIHYEFKCKPCNSIFKNKEGMDKHVNEHQELPCDICGQVFLHVGVLKRHMNTFSHTGIKSFACDKCGSLFAKKVALQKHQRNTHEGGTRNHECTECDKKFYDKFKLKQHMRIHTGEKPYECDICHKRFTQSGDRTKHRRIHGVP